MVSPSAIHPSAFHPKSRYKGSGIKITKDVVYSSPQGQPLVLDVYRPKRQSTRLPGVLVLHGGAFVKGNKTWVAWEAKVVALSGMVAFSVDYRLAPHDPYPGALRDVQAAVAFVRRHASDYGVDPSRIAVFGGSAGGTIAAEVATAGTGPLDRGTRVAAAVSWSGLLDFQELESTGSTVMRAIVAAYLQCGRDPERRCPGRLARASPINGVDPTDPPMFLGSTYGDYVPYTQSEAMQEELERQGVFVQVIIDPGHCHSFQCKGKLIIPTLGFLEMLLGVSAGERSIA